MCSIDSFSTMSVIPEKFTVFIELNTCLDKLRSMLMDDSISLVNKIQAISNFQTLIGIRMAIISELLSINEVNYCRMLKEIIDNILDKVKNLLVSGNKDEVITNLNLLGYFKENEHHISFKFDVLKEEASKQIDIVSINVVKLLVSASIYFEKLKSEYNKLMREYDEKTFGNIVDLINNYYIIITERNHIIETKKSSSKSSIRDKYVSELKRIHTLVNSEILGKDKIMHELGRFVTRSLPGSFSTRNMVKLVGGVVETTKYSLY